MVQPLRALVSLGLLVLLIWAAFKLPLGERTFAEHVDRIGQTPQAQELVDGARSTVNPVIEEATDRVLGEYVEAPTHLEVADPVQKPPSRLPRSDSGGG
ncbi:MAG: hypothetical protein AAF721_24425 [Myxococcota bacterium]